MNREIPQEVSSSSFFADEEWPTRPLGSGTVGRRAAAAGVFALIALTCSQSSAPEPQPAPHSKVVEVLPASFGPNNDSDVRITIVDSPSESLIPLTVHG